MNSDFLRKYGDIYNLERPSSTQSLRKHPRMSMEDRAKIFAPFAALRGHGDALKEEDEKKLYVVKRTLSESEIETISERLCQVKKGMQISIEYFILKNEDNMGIYKEKTGVVTGIDALTRCLSVDGELIFFELISRIQENPAKN